LVALLMVPSLLHLGLALLPEEAVLIKPATIDWRVAGFALVSIVAALVPVTAWPIARTLRARAIGPASNPAAGRTRSPGRVAIIAAQWAGAVALTVRGAFLVSSVLAVYAPRPPIHTDGVVTIDTLLSGPGGPGTLSDAQRARVTAVLDRLRQVP